MANRYGTRSFVKSNMVPSPSVTNGQNKRKTASSQVKSAKIQKTQQEVLPLSQQHQTVSSVPPSTSTSTSNYTPTQINPSTTTSNSSQDQIITPDTPRLLYQLQLKEQQIVAHKVLVEKLKLDLERVEQEKIEITHKNNLLQKRITIEPHYLSNEMNLTESDDDNNNTSFNNKLPTGVTSEKYRKKSNALLADNHTRPLVVQPTTSQAHRSQITTQSIIQPYNQMDSQVPFINRKLPQFAGKPLDDFEAWEISCNKFINQFPGKSNLEKVNYISMGVVGHAARVLQLAPTLLDTPTSLFNVLRETFGNKRTIDEAMSDVRQLKGETVRVYFSRVKTLLLTCIPDNADTQKAFDSFLMQYFKRGLNSDIKLTLGKLYTANSEITLTTACQIETEFNLQKTSKSTKDSDALYSIDSHGNQDNDPQQINIIKQHEHYKPRPLNNNQRSVYHNSQQPASGNQQFSNTRYFSNQINKNQQTKFSGYNGIQNQTDRQESTSRFLGKRPTRLECFHCHRIGHSYIFCREATQEQKNSITEDFNRYRNNNNTNNNNNSNHLNSQRSSATSSTVLPQTN